MQTPAWISPALYGAGCGAAALAIVGFSWGGWVTGGTAREMGSSASSDAIVSILTPYCIARSKQDPQSAAVLAELQAANNFNRRGIIEKAGWATPLGTDEPNRALAQACQAALSS